MCAASGSGWTRGADVMGEAVSLAGSSVVGDCEVAAHVSGYGVRVGWRRR